MNTILNLVITVVPILIFGYMLISRLKPSLHILERLSLGWLSGLGLFTIFFFLINIQGFAYNRVNGLYLLSALIFSTFLIKRKTNNNPTSNLNILSLIFPILLVVTTVIINIYLPVRSWDSLALYEYRALSFSSTGFMDQAISRGYSFGHPLLTSIMHTWAYVNNMASPMLLYSSIYATLLVSFFFAIRRIRGFFTASLFTTLLATSAEIYSHALISYTNLPYTTYLIIGIIFLTEAYRDKKSSSDNLLLSAIFIGLSTWVRSAEPFWLIVVAAAMILSIKKKSFRDMFHYLLITFGISSIWSLFKKMHLGGTQGVIGRSASALETVVDGNLSVDRAIVIFSYVYQNIILPNRILVFALLLSIPIVIKTKNTLSKLLFIVIALSFMIMYTGTYALSLIFSTWDQIGGSATRMSMFLVPLILYYLATIIFDEKN